MKNTFILILISVVALCATACSNKDAKAQAILVEAISYSDGHAPSEVAQEKALRFAESKGFKPTELSQGEVVMIAGKLLCDQIVTEYPQTPAALKAVEVRNEINQRLRTIGNERIRSLFKD